MSEVECGRCRGTGTYQATCPACDGGGYEWTDEAAGSLETQACAVCRGSGREPVLCWHCDGTGTVTVAGIEVEDEDPMREGW